MHKRRQIAAILTLVLALAGTVSALRPGGASTNRSTVISANTSSIVSTKAGSPKPNTQVSSPNRSDPRLRKIGFRSPEKLRQHFVKHGREFGDITQAQYLAMAQDLRDAPLSKTVLEAVQVGGTISRFNRSDGSFMAFDRDLTIRTFFRPDDGEAYFVRAQKRRH